jgi:hypothetical protein
MGSSIRRSDEQKDATVQFPVHEGLSIGKLLSERALQILEYSPEPGEIVMADGLREGIPPLLLSAKKHARLKGTAKNPADSVVIVERSGAFRFPVEFVRDLPSGKGSETPKGTFEEYRILNSINRYLPKKYCTYEGAFELLNESVPGMVGRIGGEDAVRKTYQSDEHATMRDSIDHIPLGNLRALVFSIYLLQDRKDRSFLRSLERSEADVRRDVRKFTRPNSTVELPKWQPGTFRTFQDQYSDIRTLPFKNWPKEL